jgi:hypothetical protein
MKSNQQGNSRKTIAVRVGILTLLGLMVGVTLGGSKAFAATSATSYDNLQVFVTPQNSSLTVFSMTVYNSTGGQVASSQSSYPAFSFELPSGNYLVTATAQSNNEYHPIPLEAGSSAPGSSGSAIVYQPQYGYQEEYGYAQINLNSSTSITLATTEVGSIKTSDVTISAKFANGTSAVGASIYASILGGDYWYYPGSVLSMSNQTGNDGTATLVVPEVPLEVTAWDWVPVNLPQNQTTTTVTVAGQPVNVTVNWEPTYIGLAGSALLVPPFQQTTITLMAQQQNFWAYPQGVASTPITQAVPGVESSGSGGTVANAPSAVPASVLNQEEGTTQTQQPSTPIVQSPNTVTLTTTATTMAPTSQSDTLIEGGIVAAVVISIAAAALALRKK